MKVPESLAPLMDAGVIQQVVQPLMSGKEAACYIVVARERYCVAKVYKEAMNRSFRQRSDYTEGRKVKNSRSARALATTPRAEASRPRIRDESSKKATIP